MPPLVLTFAASDPTGGAGIQADILTIASLGCHPLSAVTALTVQDTRGVERFTAVAASEVLAQARAVLADMPVAAFKLGVLASSENVRAVEALLREHAGVPVVLDPVLASARGDSLAGAGLLEELQARLVPLATVVTPNSHEAERLGGHQRLLRAGAKFVLVTGTHRDTPEVVNTLYSASGLVREDRWPRLPASYHGSGCTLASALAACLAKGLDASAAARAAQEYTWRALAAGFRPGQGQHLPRRLQ